MCIYICIYSTCRECCVRESVSYSAVCLECTNCCVSEQMLGRLGVLCHTVLCFGAKALLGPTCGPKESYYCKQSYYCEHAAQRRATTAVLLLYCCYYCTNKESYYYWTAHPSLESAVSESNGSLQQLRPTVAALLQLCCSQQRAMAL